MPKGLKSVLKIKKNAKKYKVKFPKQLDEALKAAKANFLETFWSEELGYFADVVNQHGRDFTVRPNQCVAGAISDLPVLKKHKKSMLQVIERELVTPFGLRTLSPADPRYCPIYSGPPEKRDAAYHQGTVWPWLIGHYTALALAAADRPAVKAKKLYENFENLFSVHLKKGCLGGLSEIYDGDPPHFYRGCFSQAWSVGETIRAWNMIQERSN